MMAEKSKPSDNQKYHLKNPPTWSKIEVSM